MISIVVVSHSEALASAAHDFAMLMAPSEKPTVTLAAGTPHGEFGTSATRILEGLRTAANPEGVLVLVDLGSAVFNAEMAIEQLGDCEYPITISEAAFVEGLTAAIAMAATGASLVDVDREALRASMSKGHQEVAPVDDRSNWNNWDDESMVSETCRVAGENGFHARPASTLVEELREIDATVRIRNTSAAGHFVRASSITELMTLGAGHGDLVLVEACGNDANAALACVQRIVGRK